MASGWLLAAALLLLPLLLLAAPLDVSVWLEKEARVRTRVRIGWLFGLVAFDAPQKPRREKAREEKPKQPPRGGLGAMLRARGFRRSLRRLLGRLWRAVHVREARLSARIGTGDPAGTGMLFAAGVPLMTLLALTPRLEWRLDPAFETPTLTGHFHASARMVPLRVAAALLAFFASAGAWRGLRAWRRARRA